ncbi:MAG: chorismate mutase [Bacteroidales bacterium]|nr:chorismate mutase [Bacteroidales bacterium]
MLEDARKNIDAIDREMAELFAKRMESAREIAQYKKERGLSVEDSFREQQIVERASQMIENTQIRKYYIDFLNFTMSLSKRYQQSLMNGIKVAYCGVEGAFAHIAAMNLFPEGTAVSYPSFNAAYKAVEDSQCDLCVLPIENSFAGDVGSVMDLIFSGSLHINRIYNLGITQSLLAKKGTKIDDIKRVISHPQALEQCAEYIERHNFRTIEYTNTALSAVEVRDSADSDIACIASEDAAKLYDLDVLEVGINSRKNNTTRFAVFSKVQEKPDKANRMGGHFILVFTVKNEAGALANALNIIGVHGFNICNLTSRPMKSLMWNYYFFMELEGNINTPDGEDMMNELSHICDRLRLAGVYTKEPEL